jgi:hypothetical protein
MPSGTAPSVSIPRPDYDVGSRERNKKGGRLTGRLRRFNDMLHCQVVSGQRVCSMTEASETPLSISPCDSCILPKMEWKYFLRESGWA